MASGNSGSQVSALGEADLLERPPQPNGSAVPALESDLDQRADERIHAEQRDQYCERQCETDDVPSAATQGPRSFTL